MTLTASSSVFVGQAGRARAGLAALLFAVGTTGVGCTEQDFSQSLRALQDSGDVSFLCRGSDGTGRDIETCPQEQDLFAMITQVSTGEIASIHAQTGRIIDVDPSIPGYTFLRVGGRPLDIVSTPGGVATFVGVGEVGREGIFAIPTTCMGAPGEGETARDLTSWPACSLPSPPGEMAILIAPPQPDGAILDRCGEGAEDQKEPIAAGRSECAADLRDEKNPPGRRKLAVMLPELGQLALIDAQELLDREPGSFDSCPIEVVHSFLVELPQGTIEQPVPEDLQGNGCIPASIPYPPPLEPFSPQPGGIALSETHTMYVADRAAPVIHVLDVSDPCQPVETPPLLPVSFHGPGRVVTTRGVAVSPVTREQKRFVYAIDELDQPSASLMVFDVSPGSTSRTPVIRTGATRLPFEPVDRIRFGASVRDIEIVKHEVPLADASGVAMGGVLCDPDPANTDTTSPGFRYRTSADYGSGAGPRTLRGIFGFAMLTDSSVGIIDIEDLDAPCRRPVFSNTSLLEDFRGCTNDPDITFTYDQTAGGTPTVTNEASCRVVQPHRARSATFAVNSPFTGTNAPALRALPRLSLDQEDKTDNPNDLPRLLGVDFPNPAGGEPLPAEVYVASALLRRAVPGEPAPDNELIVAPRTPSQFSLVLPLEEPRAYSGEEAVSLTYEGVFAGPLGTGFLEFDGDRRSLTDFGGVYCSRGVEDVRLMRDLGATRFALEGDALEEFARDHADYVQIRSALFEESDSYWQSEQGQACGGFQACKKVFGAGNERELKGQRDLRILEAYQDGLVLEPRGGGSDADKRALMNQLDCCFPGATEYAVRVSRQWVAVGSRSGFRHRISPVPVQQPDGSVRYVCARDCDPRRRYFESRVFELSSQECDPDVPQSDPAACIIGHDPDAEYCAYDDREDVNGVTVFGAAVGLTGPGSACIFQSLTARFAVYRGRLASQRDMAFSWETFGGFSALNVNIAQQLRTANVLPQSMVYVPQLRRLAVVDGATTGLSLIGLTTLRVSEPSPYY